MTFLFLSESEATVGISMEAYSVQPPKANKSNYFKLKSNTVNLDMFFLES